MNRLRKILMRAVVATTLLSSVAYCQTNSADNYIVEGQVTDWVNDKGIEAVTVEAEHVHKEKSSTLSSTLTTATGSYRLEHLPKKIRLTLRFHELGYSPYPEEVAITLQSDKTVQNARLFRANASEDYLKAAAAKLFRANFGPKEAAGAKRGSGDYGLAEANFVAQNAGAEELKVISAEYDRQLALFETAYSKGELASPEDAGRILRSEQVSRSSEQAYEGTGSTKVDERLAESTEVLKTIATRSEIPNTAWSKTKCVLIYPSVKKVGIGIGVSYGRGVLVCRTGADMTGPWGAPIMYTLDTGSLGAQLGSSSTDYVLLIITQRGANKILSGKLKLGADASAVAGPTGTNAAAFNDPNIDVLSYSQSKGLFAGASLGTASMTSDDKVNAELYNKDIDGTQLLRTEKIPPAAQALIDVLQKASPRYR